MPALGESVTEGTVTRWLKEVGEEVAVDEPLVEVSTDKVDTEVPSPVAGTLLEIVADTDDVVAVGGRLAVIGEAGAAPAAEAPAAEAPAEPEPEPEAAPAPAAEAPQEEAPQAEAPKAEAPKAEAPKEEAPKADGPKDMESTPYVTPLVRKLAAENDVDLNSVTGTGVGGRIRKQDVLAAAEAAKAPAPEAAPAAAPAAAAARWPPPRRARSWRPCAAPRRRSTGSVRSRRPRHVSRCRARRS